MDLSFAPDFLTHLVRDALHAIGQLDLSHLMSQVQEGAQDAPTISPPAPLDPVSTNAIGEQTEFSDESFSMWALFMRADLVVKAVMLMLLAASFWSWAIIVEKWSRYGSVRKKTDRFEQTFWSGRSLEDLYNTAGAKPDNPMAVVFAAAMREWRRSQETGPVQTAFLPSVKERIDRVMSVTITRESERIERNLGFLATVGSTAPFVGLFGTVWGIMNSFRAIAVSQDTNLAVVAPGIAEALFATALGLLAAIPAVIFYNRYVSEAGRLTSRLDGFADEFSAILSRQLDERAR
ncbi:MAG TPA: protein TolQ [Micropepsaceae bacterium]|nr:protein TolQ [Micropepsaceae bacterium]